MTNRRDFIKQSALMGAAILVAPLLGAGTTHRVGLQLYTLRGQIGDNVSDIISKVARAGYGSVETYGYSTKSGYWGMEPKAFAKLLSDNGLICPSGHYDFEPFFDGKTDTLKANIDAAKTIGSEFITVPFLALNRRNDYNKIADLLNKAGEICSQNNIKLAYHNHDFEFKSSNNQTGLDTLLKNTDPKLVQFELDLYWVVRAGSDPIDLFAKYPGRFAMLHVKDMNKKNPAQNTEVGKGSINFKAIFKDSVCSGVKHFFVEQENNYEPNPLESIKYSVDYLKKLEC